MKPSFVSSNGSARLSAAGNGFFSSRCAERNSLINRKPLLLAARRIYSKVFSRRISTPRMGLILFCRQKSTKSQASQVELILVRARVVAPASTPAFTSSSVDRAPYLKLLVNLLSRESLVILGCSGFAKCQQEMDESGFYN